MTRYAFILNSSVAKDRALSAIRKAPFGTRIELKAAKRTIPQSDKMWAILSDIAMHAEHGGRKYTPDIWKCIFLSALGRELQFIPALDGVGLIPYGNHSSDLSKEEMSNLIDFMGAWCAEHNITLHGESLPTKEAAV